MLDINNKIKLFINKIIFYPEDPRPMSKIVLNGLGAHFLTTSLPPTGTLGHPT